MGVWSECMTVLPHESSALGGQKRVLDILKLEFQTTVSWQVGAVTQTWITWKIGQCSEFLTHLLGTHSKVAIIKSPQFSRTESNSVYLASSKLQYNRRKTPLLMEIYL